MSTFFGLGLQQRFDPSLTNPEPNRTGRHVGQLSTVQPCEKMGVSGMSKKLSGVSEVSDRKLDTLDARTRGSVRFVSGMSGVVSGKCPVCVSEVSGWCPEWVSGMSGTVRKCVRNVRPRLSLRHHSAAGRWRPTGLQFSRSHPSNHGTSLSSAAATLAIPCQHMYEWAYHDSLHGSMA